MSLREEVVAIRAEKAKQPPELVGYRLIATPKQEYRVVCEYKPYDQEITTHIINTYSSLKGAVAHIVGEEGKHNA